MTRPEDLRERMTPGLVGGPYVPVFVLNVVGEHLRRCRHIEVLGAQKPARVTTKVAKEGGSDPRRWTTALAELAEELAKTRISEDLVWGRWRPVREGVERVMVSGQRLMEVSMRTRADTHIRQSS